MYIYILYIYTHRYSLYEYIHVNIVYINIYMYEYLWLSLDDNFVQDYEMDALNNLKKILSGKWDFVTMQAEEQVGFSCRMPDFLPALIRHCRISGPTLI